MYAMDTSNIATRDVHVVTTDTSDPYDNLPELDHGAQTDRSNLDGLAPPPYYSTNAEGAPVRLQTTCARALTSPGNVTQPDVRITAMARDEISDYSLTTAYILVALGFLGAHHFYLNRPRFGILYLFTMGLLSLGWLSDVCRLPALVKRTNRRLMDPDSYFSGHEDRDLLYVYLMWLPFGIIGLHQYYLRRWKWGVLYTLTFGVFTVGWMIDAYRNIPMTRDCNQKLADERNHVRQDGPRVKTVLSAYLLAIPPVGILGGHHYYLGRRGFGILYTLTGGLFLVGWLADLVRMCYLVRRINKKTIEDYNTASESHLVKKDKTIHIDDAYVLHCSPFGLIGASHFYMGRYKWAAAYFSTCGFFTIGWMIDMFRMPKIVRDINKRQTEQNQIEIEVRGDAQIIVLTDGRIIADAGTGAGASVVVSGAAPTGCLEPDGPPPSYDSVFAESVADGAPTHHSTNDASSAIPERANQSAAKCPNRF